MPSAIEWTDVTWNPVVEERIGEPLRWRKPRRVFVNSMSDLFHESVDERWVTAIFGVMAATPQHTYQVLTKRPDRMRAWLASREAERVWDWVIEHPAACGEWDPRHDEMPWPLPHVWLGVSVEDQATADERIPLLLECPASVRWVSYEPALGPIRFDPNLLGCVGHLAETFGNPLIHWIVVGGESGPGARPFDVAWARSVRDQCAFASVPYFLKQLGSRPWATCGRCRGDGIDPVRVGHDPDWCAACGGAAQSIEPQPLALDDRKGGAPEEWPADLRVREWPEQRRLYEAARRRR